MTCVLAFVLPWDRLPDAVRRRRPSDADGIGAMVYTVYAVLTAAIRRSRPPPAAGRGDARIAAYLRAKAALYNPTPKDGGFRADRRCLGRPAAGRATACSRAASTHAAEAHRHLGCAAGRVETVLSSDADFALRGTAARTHAAESFVSAMAEGRTADPGAAFPPRHVMPLRRSSKPGSCKRHRGISRHGTQRPVPTPWSRPPTSWCWHNLYRCWRSHWMTPLPPAILPVN